MVAAALGAGEHGVVVGEDHRPRALVVEEVAVDRGGAGDHAVGGRVLPQLLVAVLLVLAGHDQRPVLLEGTGVDELLDVLARRPEAEPAPPGDRLRPVLVERVGVAADVLLEVGPDVVRVDLRRGFSRLAALGSLDQHERIALPDRVADGHRDPEDRAARVGSEHVLHLHRLDHGDLLPAQDLVAFLYVDAHDGALDRRDDAPGAFRAVGLAGRVDARGAFRAVRLAAWIAAAGRIGLRGPRGLRLLVVGEQRQGIGRVDAGPREAAVRRGRGGRAAAASAGTGGGDESGPAPVAGGRRQLARVVVEPPGVEASRLEVRVAEDALQPGDVRVRSRDAELVERPRRPLDGGGEVVRGRVGDHLREQRVEGGVRLVARVAAAVRPHARSARRFVGGKHAPGRTHGALGVQGLQVDAGLDGEAARPDGFRRPESEFFERLARRDAQLSLHEIDPGDGFGDRVLDLKAGVRLDEREAAARLGGRTGAIAAVAARIGVDEELERAQAAVLRGAAQAQRRLDDRGAQGGAEVGCRSGLDHFLVPALGAALAFAEVDEAAGFVAEKLDLDVPGAPDQFLDVQAAVAERALGLGPAALPGLLDLVRRGDDAGSAAASAGNRLDDHRLAVAQAGEELARLLQGRRPVGAAQHRDVRAGRRGARPALVAEEPQHLGPRADECNAGLGAGGGEGRVLGQEAVTGVDRVAVGLDRARHDSLDVEVRRHAAAVQHDGLVGDPQVQSVRVVLGVDGDGGDPEIRRRAGDPYRDLASVGDQQPLHGSAGPLGGGVCAARSAARSVGDMAPGL